MTRAALQAAIIDRIVADLTPGMRAALLWLPSDGGWRYAAPPHTVFLWKIATRPVCTDDIEAQLLIQGVAEPAPNGRGWMPSRWRLNRFGKLVRARVAGAKEAADAA